MLLNIQDRLNSKQLGLLLLTILHLSNQTQTIAFSCSRRSTLTVKSFKRITWSQDNKFMPKWINSLPQYRTVMGSLTICPRAKPWRRTEVARATCWLSNKEKKRSSLPCRWRCSKCSNVLTSSKHLPMNRSMEATNRELRKRKKNRLRQYRSRSSSKCSSKFSRCSSRCRRKFNSRSCNKFSSSKYSSSSNLCNSSSKSQGPYRLTRLLKQTLLSITPKLRTMLLNTTICKKLSMISCLSSSKRICREQ